MFHVPCKTELMKHIFTFPNALLHRLPMTYDEVNGQRRDVFKSIRCWRKVVVTYRILFRERSSSFSRLINRGQCRENETDKWTSNAETTNRNFIWFIMAKSPFHDKCPVMVFCNHQRSVMVLDSVSRDFLAINSTKTCICNYYINCLLLWKWRWTVVEH